MTTNKHIDIIAIICMLLAIVFVFAMALTWTPVDASSHIKVSKNDISKLSGRIVFCSDGTSVIDGKSIAVNGDVCQIAEGGTYHFSGVAKNKQIFVDVPGTEQVILVLEGLELSCENDSPIYVSNSGACVLYLMEGTDNIISSGITLSKRDQSAEGGALTFKDDAAVCGEGTLTVNGFINNGIHCSNNLYIDSGNITVSANNKAIKGGDSLTVNGGNINVLSSYEGLEGNHITINEGNLNITASDDGINANGGMNLFGHFPKDPFSDNKESEEGTKDSDTPSLTINGGTIYVRADGDGLDSNGDLIINGGVTIVDGPANSANGALDSGMENGGRLIVNGGTILAMGAGGMAEIPESGNENVRILNFRSSFSQGDAIEIKDTSGKTVFEHKTQTSGSSIIFSSPDLAQTAEYTVSGCSGSAAEETFGRFGGERMPFDNRPFSEEPQKGFEGNKPFDKNMPFDDEPPERFKRPKE